MLEFVADEGKIYIPYWMMQNLMLEEGGLIQVGGGAFPTMLGLQMFDAISVAF